ncbi:MAG: YciI family protein [Chthoniobacter sp.]|uniref:YciI family protein n=1 Tax=Chthoniobacter sp. TaxID=2510640 RepID=UPI0032AB6324
MSTDRDTPPHVDGYLLLFRGNPWDNVGHSTEELQQIMDRVTAWFDKLQQEGKFVSGSPLMDRATTVTGDGGRSVVDGPFAEAKEAIGGFVLLNVNSMEEAVAVARSNPMLKHGLITEVREVASDCPHFYRVRQKLALAAAG